MNPEEKQIRSRRMLAQQLEKARSERVLKEIRALAPLVEELARRRSTPPRGQAVAKK